MRVSRGVGLGALALGRGEGEGRVRRGGRGVHSCGERREERRRSTGSRLVGWCAIQGLVCSVTCLVVVVRSSSFVVVGGRESCRARIFVA